MRRGFYLSIIILAGCMAAVVLSAVLIGYSFGVAATAAEATAVPAAAVAFHEEPPTPAIDAEPEEQAAPEVEEQNAERSHVADSIAVPGFDQLTAVGRVIRDVGVFNPPQNKCYFIASFHMPDGTEVYRSGILAPGQSLGDIGLSQQIEPGTYEGAVARYSAYALDTMQPLNGADIKFTLEVLP